VQLLAGRDIKQSWGKLFGKSNEDVQVDINDAELVSVVSEILGCSNCGLDEVTEWIKSVLTTQDFLS
jgi:hypothetical protein